MRIYILGVSGMLGSELFMQFNKIKTNIVRGSARSKDQLMPYPFKKVKIYNNIDFGISAFNFDKVKKKIKEFNPNYLINCIGVIKQKINKLSNYKDIIYINSIFPHKLHSLTNSLNIRLIHFSTDCVFDGKKGGYLETSKPNAKDLYGISKYWGEINSHNSLTIRTSIIGHEFGSKKGLLEWFINKRKECNGYTNSFFSGVTTFEVFKFINNCVFKKKKISGLVHLYSSKISKFNLLKLIAKIYKKNIVIKKENHFKINRSLNSKYLRNNFRYKVPNWSNMIKKMLSNHKFVN